MKRKCQIPRDSVLKRIHKFFRMLCRSSEDYFFATDVAANIVMLSPNMVIDFGAPAEVFYDMDDFWLPRIHPDDYEAYVADLHRTYTPMDSQHNTEYRVKDVHGNYIWMSCRGQMSFNAQTKEPELFAGIMSRMDQQLQADTVTGLLNTNQFEKAIKNALQRVDGEINPGAVMFFGIDNFKIVNESLNRKFGDELLKIAAECISSVLPDNVMLYKLDGDEFAIVVPGLDEAGVEKLFGAVQKSFGRPHEIENRNVFCTMSAGTVFYPQGGKDYLVLHKHGEAALDQAKREGKNKNVIFTKDHYNRWLRSLSMRDYLQESIDNNFEGFSLFFQPQVNAITQKLEGAEALLRWRSPRGRMVAPREFIRILEETKMIIPVGRWIFETAVIQCKKWQEILPGMHISINLSYEQIKGAGFKDFVVDCLKRHDMPPELIVLELTETAIVSDWNNVNQQFDDFRRLGIRIAMDDFGTGYSSLAYLKNLSCDIIKIDRAFVTHITEPDNKFDCRLVACTIDLCHSLGMHCCIEGVETEEEYALLKDECGADSIQGYLFGRPEDPEKFAEKFFQNM